MVLKQLTNNPRFSFLYVGFLLIVVSYFFYQSLGYTLHDFSNSYFASKLITEGGSPSQMFDIYAFNSYIWNLGYPNVLVDFYINSPFTISFFYPFTFIEDPFIAKALFNVIGIILFVWSIIKLIQKVNPSLNYILGLIPILFFIPLRNQILFGQSYFLLLSFVIFGYLYLSTSQKKLGAILFSAAILLKIVPVIYGMYLLFKKQWKSIFYIGVSAILLLLFSVLITGLPVWETYLVEVLPNAILNNSTVDFRYNAQSMDVFLKTVFIKDSYYNPDGLFSNERLFYLFKWLYKSILIGLAIIYSLKEKNNPFVVVSIWVVTLFLIQSRTATYAQIFWILPIICFLTISQSNIKKVLFLGIVFLISNLPMYELQFLPLFFKFSRLWLSLLVAIIFFSEFSLYANFKWVFVTLILLLPLHSKIFMAPKEDTSVYVLDKKEHFLVYDFFEKNGYLFIKTLGKNGDETINTQITINSFVEDKAILNKHQLLYKNELLVDDYSLKKKPVIVNENEVYYLTDHRSRRGVYTLKKVTIETVP